MNLPPELRLSYIERRKKDIEDLKAALATKDVSVAQRVGHQLKGNGVTYGFPLLSELGRDLENAAMIGNHAEIEKLLHSLEAWLSSIS